MSGTVPNPDNIVDVTGMSGSIGEEAIESSTCSVANTSRCGTKRPKSKVSSTSKRSKSEVWLLAGRSDVIGDGDEGTQFGQESGEVMITGKEGEKFGKGVASETPRSITTGVASNDVRRRLHMSTPGSPQQRSRTIHQARASNGVVTMQVEMQTKKGTERVTYRVKLTTRMEKVIEKVALRIGKRMEQVILTKDKHPVDPTAMAAIYTDAQLVASARL